MGKFLQKQRAFTGSVLVYYSSILFSFSQVGRATRLALLASFAVSKIAFAFVKSFVGLTKSDCLINVGWRFTYQLRE